MPKDPRQAVGSCQRVAARQNRPDTPLTMPFNPPLEPWMTGGTGAGELPFWATEVLLFPPSTQIDGASASDLPHFVPGGTPITLDPGPTPKTMAPGVTLGNGWHNPNDGGVWYSASIGDEETLTRTVPAPGCKYASPYATAPTPPPCPAQDALRRRDQTPPEPTAPPAAPSR